MRDRIINGVLLAVLLAVGFMAIRAISQQPTDPTIANATTRLELEKLSLEQARTLELAPLVTVRDGFFTLAPILLIIGVFTCGVYTLRKHFGMIRPDALGLYPTTVGTSDDLARLSAIGYHQTQLAAASQQPVPQTLTYAPHVIYKPQHELPPAQGVGLVPPTVPAFSTLLATGVIGQGQPLLLGYGESGAITGTWRDLYSAAVAGLSGSGKTTTLRFLACQSALQGGRFLIVDPHADSGNESLAGTLQALSTAFLRPPATNDKAILATVKYAQMTLTARIQGRDTDHSPVIVCCDEFTSLMRSTALTEPLGGLLESIAQQGRKVGVFALLSGQIWSADRAGGSSLRDSLASAYVHRIKRAQSRMLLGIGERLPDTSDLKAGECYLLRSTGEIVKATIPLTTQADIEVVGRQLGSAFPHTGNQELTLGNHAETHTLTAENSEAETSGNQAETMRETQIVALFAAGKSRAQVIQTLYGVTGGRGYTSAGLEVDAVIAKLARSQTTND